MKRLFLLCLALLLTFSVCGCGKAERPWDVPPEIPGYGEPEKVPLTAASCFAIWRYENGDSLILTDDGTVCLIAEDPPDGIENAVVVPKRPKTVYMAASAVMSFWDALDRLGDIRFSSLEAEDWHIDGAREAMEAGDMLFAGKYREPDYELLLTGGCDLSVQSTMAEHVPKVKEKLAEIGIPVFVDRSSYENDPLGRVEWIKVYAEIAGCPEKGEALFAAQKAAFDAVGEAARTGKTVAFFYVAASGNFVTRKSGDYVSKMIRLAGGENVFDFGGEDNALSSVTVGAEDFCLRAKDADIIVYNASIGGDVTSIAELVAKNELLASFRAVKTGNVWRTDSQMYQDIMKTGEILTDFYRVISENGEAARYLEKLD